MEYLVEQKFSNFSKKFLPFLRTLLVASYFNRIKKLLDELIVYITYPPCTCNYKIEWTKLECEQQVHQFLAGKNDLYSGIRWNILMIKPLLDIDSAYPF